MGNLNVQKRGEALQPAALQNLVRSLFFSLDKNKMDFSIFNGKTRYGVEISPTGRATCKGRNLIERDFEMLAPLPFTL